MTEKSLEMKVKEAASEVSKWHDRIAIIQSKINAAKKVLAGAEERRARHALGAATGEESDADEMRHIREECVAAERDLADLELALPGAQRNLAQAQQVETAALRDKARKDAEVLMRERIEVSAKLDLLLTQANVLAERYDELGGKFGPYYLAKHGYTDSNRDALLGINRCAAALPRFIRRLFPTFPYGSYTPLAQSEASFLNLPVAITKAKNKSEVA